ncbi:short chain dehydrogenase/reductase SDR [Microthyrium microscopicum]|uniref:Short chain dehydrogenase/reductase SDR n=1 Tax=Microthyrium microscopicum TaxID=703497 RepID=A0A6A6TYD0_9PEZI|nr:short chain dehydrogenase/reductase SDR [Microthyrium microscopicum]
MNSPFTLRTDVYDTISHTNLKQSLTGKNALITGSGRGIGRYMALALVEAGANVAVTGRTASQVNSTVQTLEGLAATVKELQGLENASKIIGITADVLVLADQERLVDQVHKQLGAIDILICNAGSNIFQPFHLTDATSWWDVMELNVRAPVELTRLVLPDFRERNSGTIIFTSSRAATADLPWTTSYNCAKTAITRFAGTLQAELEQVQKIEGKGANGVQVFSIHPGEIETELHQTAFPEKTKKEAPYVVEFMDMIGKKRPHFEGRLPAWTCVWLCSGRGERLKGRYVDCTRDVVEQAEAAEKERAGAVTMGK